VAMGPHPPPPVESTKPPRSPISRRTVADGAPAASARRAAGGGGSGRRWHGRTTELVLKPSVRYAPGGVHAASLSAQVLLTHLANEVAKVAQAPPPTSGAAAGWGASIGEGGPGLYCSRASPLPGRSSRDRRCLVRELHRFLQQEETRCTVPLWFFRRPTQSVIAGFLALLFGVLGIGLLQTASGIYEARFSYLAGDEEKVIDIEQDIEGTALFSYELPELYTNQKRFVESKDNPIVGGVLSRYNCKDAETIEEVRWRRCPSGTGCENDSLIRNLDRGGSSFRPCGLVALSMFTDRFELKSLEDDRVIRLDESSVALESDNDIFKGKIVPVDRPSTASPNDPYFEVEGEPSWLESGAFYEHFKVWYRQAPSPHVRNLWATIPGGLKRGRYRLRIIENNPVWNDAWEVPEKRVVISQAHSLGSPGCCRLLGVLSIVFCCVQVGITCSLMFASGPEGKRS